MAKYITINHYSIKLDNIMSNHDLLVRHQQEKLALNLVHSVGELRFDKGIESIMFRKAIYDAKPS